MSPTHYTTKVLPDGHIPPPKDFPLKAGDDVEVTLASVAPETDEELGRRQRDHFLKNWAGKFTSGKTDISENHDKYLSEEFLR